ncbi:MAG: hypothetical protein BJ554DRAFT_3015 [Olpidium bornovanus]|uniref:TATA-box-binding protein n=1 Tax=Olpidium bornovanus TaxID=278681 RepID=A0A8H7ZQ54_9FUNG|nr:MAG: hypothetical protein BJ554DRAFT_3015 [Olpidium bornovanus]
MSPSPMSTAGERSSLSDAGDNDAAVAGSAHCNADDGQPTVELETVTGGILPTLQNIVATVNLETPLDLKTIALHARNAEYNPKRFAAVIMRIREPKTTALIFASGKMVVTGAKSEDDSRLAARKYARIVQKLGFQAKFTEFKIQNIVGSCDVKFPIRLEGLAVEHGPFCSVSPATAGGRVKGEGERERERFCEQNYRLSKLLAPIAVVWRGQSPA